VDSEQIECISKEGSELKLSVLCQFMLKKKFYVPILTIPPVIHTLAENLLLIKSVSYNQ
jgi:hypothetical protein